jgi:hypothetical protein
LISFKKSSADYLQRKQRQEALQDAREKIDSKQLIVLFVIDVMAFFGMVGIVVKALMALK